jgi:hypothetical protein
MASQAIWDELKFLPKCFVVFWIALHMLYRMSDVLAKKPCCLFQSPYDLLGWLNKVSLNRPFVFPNCFTSLTG